MGIEIARTIDELYPFWPIFHDYKREWAAHIRGIKTALQGSFPTVDLVGISAESVGQCLYAKSSGSDIGYELTMLPSDITLDEASATDSELLAEDEWAYIDHGTIPELEITTSGLYSRQVWVSFLFLTGQSRPKTLSLGVRYGTAGEVATVLTWELNPSAAPTFFYKTFFGSFVYDYGLLEAAGLIDTEDEIRFYIKGTGFGDLDTPPSIRDVHIVQEAFA